MEIDVEIKEIKELLSMLNEKMDLLIGDREALSMMKLAESSLKAFFEGEPELYDVGSRKPMTLVVG
jgi:hypothetical protein